MLQPVLFILISASVILIILGVNIPCTVPGPADNVNDCLGDVVF